MSTFPIDAIRNRFPGLDQDWIFFDNAGGSFVLDTVIERAAEYMRNTPVQLGASYAVSELATQRQAAAEKAMAAYLNARDPREVVIGPSTTEMIGRLARALRPTLDEGDEIIVTDIDHEANIGAWRRLAETGIAVKTWPVNPDTLHLELDDLAPLMNERTRLVAFTHCSNIVGSIEPVAEIAKFVHARGAQICVDGVAFAPHRRVDVQALDVDYYVFSTYKTYGPHLAVLYGKQDLLLALDNLNHEFIGRDTLPYKLQPGAVSYELAWSLTAIPEYFQWLHAEMGVFEEDIAAHETALMNPLLEFIDARPDLHLLGEAKADPARRVPTIAFTVDGRDSADVPPPLDAKHIAVRFGHFYAKRLIDKLGLAEKNGVVRASMVHYNTVEEVEMLVHALDEIL